MGFEVVELKPYNAPIISRYVRSVGMVDQVSARKFLEAAKALNDPTLFHSVYKFFEQRNIRLHNTTSFTRGEHCQVYVKHFENLYHGINNGCHTNLNSNISTCSSQN